MGKGEFNYISLTLPLICMFEIVWKTQQVEIIFNWGRNKPGHPLLLYHLKLPFNPKRSCVLPALLFSHQLVLIFTCWTFLHILSPQERGMASSVGYYVKFSFTHQLKLLGWIGDIRWFQSRWFRKVLCSSSSIVVSSLINDNFHSLGVSWYFMPTSKDVY